MKKVTKEFLGELLRKECEKKYKKEIEVEIKDIYKQNEKVNVFCVNGLIQNIGINIHTEEFEFAFGMDAYTEYVQPIIDRMMEHIEVSLHDMVHEDVLVEAMVNYKNRIKFELVDSMLDAERLAKMPHLDTKFGMSLIYTIVVNDEMRVGVTHEVVKFIETYTEITKEIMNLCAYKNTFEREEVLFDEVPSFMFDNELPLSAYPRDFKLEQTMLYALSNESKLKGSVLITSNEILNRIRDMMGSDFYILPSSVHKVMIASVNHFNVDELRMQLRNANEECLQPNEVLSDSIFIFNGECVERC